MIILTITNSKKPANSNLNLLGLSLAASCTPNWETSKLPAATGNAKL